MHEVGCGTSTKPASCMQLPLELRTPLESNPIGVPHVYLRVEFGLVMLNQSVIVAISVIE